MLPNKWTRCSTCAQKRPVRPDLTMTKLTVCALLVTLFAVCYSKPADEFYDAGLTANVDIDEILKNDRLRTTYIRCFETGEKCTNRAKQVRALIPEAMKTECSKCTPDQKEMMKKVIQFELKNHPDEFLRLEKKHDPEHEYRTKYGDRLKEEGIVLPAPI